MIVSSSSIFCIAALVFSSIERVYFRVDPPTFRYICLQLVSVRPMAAATFFQGMPFARMSFINFNSYEDQVVFRTLLCAIFSTSSLLIVPSTRSNRIFEISSSTDFFCPFAALTPPTIGRSSTRIGFDENLHLSSGKMACFCNIAARCGARSFCNARCSIDRTALTLKPIFRAKMFTIEFPRTGSSSSNSSKPNLWRKTNRSRGSNVSNTCSKSSLNKSRSTSISARSSTSVVQKSADGVAPFSSPWSATKISDVSPISSAKFLFPVARCIA
mmetsp:Transcript_7438/g.22431  ORF Transcript_7438/g.22431 Transcript_7438/m.22431 type:complete len:272 (+) Transcript_7438:1090-1905(+)